MPELYADLARYWDCFAFLNNCRQYGMSASPLLLTEILAYLNERDILDKRERREFEFYVKALDREYLTFQAERQSKPQSKKPKGKR